MGIEVAEHESATVVVHEHRQRGRSVVCAIDAHLEGRSMWSNGALLDVGDQYRRNGKLPAHRRYHSTRLAHRERAEGEPAARLDTVEQPLGVRVHEDCP